ncbi:MAG: gliding motility-associated C-terminal domain-containing protein, partial [Putridiphycobacter sp.]|nr:gliding motility-associated C-terminal domain-containing protein [Putridiphycobacter sp.]
TGNWFGEYNGLMDDVRVWDYPVTDAEILARYSSPLVGNEIGLAAYYNMDITGSGAGTVVPNISTSTPTGVLDGVALGTANTPLFLNPVGSLATPLFGSDTTLCIGESLLLDASGFAGDYLWQDGSTDTVYTVTQPGLYFVSITNNCEVFNDSIQVSYAPAPTVNLGNDTLLCQGDVLVLDASNIPGASSFIWQDSSMSSTFTVSQSGIYSVYVDVNGCQGYDEIVVDYSVLYLDLGPPDSVICENTVISFNISQPGATYLWQDGSLSSQYFLQDSGLYIATVSNAVCEITDSIHISVNTIEANFNYSTTAQCGTSPIMYFDSSLVNFGYIASLKWFVDGKQLLFGSTPTQHVNASKTQNVTLKVESNFGCTAETSNVISVTVFEEPIVNFALSNSNPSVGELISFTNTSINSSAFIWQIDELYTSDSASIHYRFPNEGYFKVQLIGSNELCSDTVVKYVTVKPPLVYYIPNAFTPNFNNRNETFLPVFTSGFDPYEFDFTIYNRWGEIVFNSKNSTAGWDGTYANQLVQEGVYVWKVTFLNLEIRERVSDYGTVTVFY